jgi:hypothetical protein
MGQKSFFIEGVAGGGKTWLLRLICNKIRGEGKIVLATAATGIAALLMERASTTHKQFNIPINAEDDSFCTLQHGTQKANLIKQASLIIIDEANMLSKKAFNALDRSLRDLTKINEPFGDIPTLVCGDWRQILTVVKNGTYADVINSTLKKTSMWGKMRKFRLSVNLRLHLGIGEDMVLQQEWAQTLLDIGNGTTGPVARLFDEICMPTETMTAELIGKVYGNIRSDPAAIRPEELGKKAILTPLNDIVDATNTIIVDMLPGQQHTFYSCDEMKDFDDPDYRVPTEFLHSLTPSNTPPHELSLKVGTVVMIMRNLDQESGLQNGTRIQVTTIKEFAIQGIIITEGPFFKKPCIIPRIKFVIDDPTLFGFTFTRIQFPINVAFAMTIHKSEGQTLLQVGLYLPDPVFTHGMLYTALSRCTTRKGVTVLLGVNQRPPDKHEGWYTANIVFRNVLIEE